jgi:putative membrane protein insertion efficiency factor
MTRLLLASIALYRRFLSPLLGPTCRFHPSGSAYAATCIERHGAWWGVLYTVRRLSRCHPLHPGGEDLPPPARTAPGAARSSAADTRGSASQLSS